MDDLIAFLRLRLDEDHRTALAAHTGAGWGVETDMPGGPRVLSTGEEDFTIAEPAEGRNAVQVARHIARYDPARVLAEVRAKRRILDHYESASRAEGFEAQQAGRGVVGGIASGAETAVRCLATVYRDHPDFRPEWAPEWAELGRP